MPHPREGYKAKDGKKVPSVTTVIGKFKESGGIIHWAWNLGMQGIDYRAERDRAADIGSIAHDMFDLWAHGKTIDSVIAPEELLLPASTAFSAFSEWAENSRLRIEHTELSLISERHRFAGCLDACVMSVNGRRAIGDYKTSNHVYSDYMLQIAAYAILWDENFPDKPIDGGFHLIRFAKDHPDFSHHYWPELDDAKRAFLLMRELYDLKIALDKRVQ